MFNYPHFIYSLIVTDFWNKERESYSLLLIWNLCPRRGWVSDTMPRALGRSGKTQYLFYRKLAGPQGWAGQVWKTCLYRVSNPELSSP